MAVSKHVTISATSTDSWEDAALKAVERTEASVEHIQAAEIVEQTLDFSVGAEPRFETKVSIEFHVEELNEGDD
ncbi:Flavin-binding protein dodecin [Halogranum amylolyticum]|uniref:Flavin-binding protein dodecin n=1 Tax=Halogranum amylolyticum TaxID=660520 RepID=A0A1H8NEC4_9EURY|nr:dodecin family protein [Halogranum amylolyticum]SEO27937.1 Flavin-binding protein dodecin [Halogranum amylolyticum]